MPRQSVLLSENYKASVWPVKLLQQAAAVFTFSSMGLLTKRVVFFAKVISIFFLGSKKSFHFFSLPAKQCGVVNRVLSTLRIRVYAVLCRRKIVNSEPADKQHHKCQSKIPLQLALVYLVAECMKVAQVG